MVPVKFVPPASFCLQAPKWHWDRYTIVVETPYVLQDSTFWDRRLRNSTVSALSVSDPCPWAVMRFCPHSGCRHRCLAPLLGGSCREMQQYLRKQGLKPLISYSGEKGYGAPRKRSDIDLVYRDPDSTISRKLREVCRWRWSIQPSGSQRHQSCMTVLEPDST